MVIDFNADLKECMVKVLVEELFHYYTSYVSIVSPPFKDIITKAIETKTMTIKEVVDDVVKQYRETKLVQMFFPTDNPVDLKEAVNLVQEYFPPTYQPITYAGGFVTKKPVLIGSLYMLILEKSFTASSAK